MLDMLAAGNAVNMPPQNTPSVFESSTTVAMTAPAKQERRTMSVAVRRRRTGAALRAILPKDRYAIVTATANPATESSG